MSIVDETYATLAEANTALSGIAPWSTAGDPAKQTALEWATVYMNDTYEIPAGSVSSGLVQANAQLANEHLKSDLFLADRAGMPARGLVSASVEATGAAKTSKTYDPYITKSWMDPFPAITAMLKYYGFLLKKASGGMRTVSLVRR